MANLTQTKRTELIKYIEKLKELHNDDESLIMLNQIEKDLISKKYGLVWEKHEENVDVMMKDNIPVFTEEKNKEINFDRDNDYYNFLLEGDNLHSLKLLEKTHKGKIDVIYIDPPYNTGTKDFVYDDLFVDKQDGYRHSKWISFMNERLRIAKKLLSNTGTIFISIDDNEEAPLKILCDEIFGCENRIGVVTVVHKPEGRNQAKYFATSNEFALFYAKNKSNFF